LGSQVQFSFVGEFLQSFFYAISNSSTADKFENVFEMPYFYKLEGDFFFMGHLPLVYKLKRASGRYATGFVSFWELDSAQPPEKKRDCWSSSLRSSPLRSALPAKPIDSYKGT
jgi:hypothetical protein